MIVLDLSILNQKGTPMFNSDLTANRPAAGIVGRIFIAIDSPYGIFRDTGTGWDQISSGGGADTNIYNTDGTLTGTRTVSSGGFQLVFNPQTTFFSSLTASTGASSFSVLGSNALSFAAAFSSSNIGNVYAANGAINSQTFLGNATFAQANLASAMVNVNKITLDSGGHTITMTQSTAPGIRAMTGVQNQIQYTGTHNGTISHAAISQNLGFFRDTGAIRTLTITNAYSLLLNPLDDYGAGFTFTNRWGIYQAGASDKNYFAGNILAGSTTDNGERLQITGTSRFTGLVTMVSNQITWGTNFVSNGVLLYDGGSSTDKIGIGVTSAGGLGLFSRVNSLWLSATNDAATMSASNAQIQISNTQILGIVPFVKNSVGNSLIFDGLGGTTNRYGIGVIGSNNGTAIFSGTLNPTILFGIGFDGTNMTLSNCTMWMSTTSLQIGTNTELASSILTLESTTKGFRLPVMTNAQRTAISTPAVGLIVYCTDAVEGLYVNKSTGWTFII
jgi:hypothetical protein